MPIQIISKKNITPSVWDGGKTFQYLIYPQESTYAERNFDFRISTATIEKSPSDFTNFEGYNRFLIMLDNDLEIIRNEKREIYRSKEIFSFNSADKIQSFSKGNDFNLMIRANFTHSELHICKIFTSSYSFIFAYSLENTEAEINGQKYFLSPGDLVFIANLEQEKVSLFSDCEMIIGSINGRFEN